MQSETAVAAVPGAADAWSNVNNFTVPAGVARLKQIIVGVAPDPGALAQMHVTPVLRFLGSGLLEQSPHFFLCQAIDLSITAANSGGGVVEPENMVYNVDIPVSVGGQIVVDQLDINEVPAAQTTRVELVYDNQAPTTKNNMADYVTTSTMPAADTWTTVGTLTVPRLTDQSNPHHIDRIVCGLNPDEAGNTLIRNSTRFRITGSGIAEGGRHEYLASQKGVMWTTPGAQAVGHSLVSYDPVDIPVNPGGTILVEAITDVEVPAGGTYVFGVQYD